MSDPNDPTDSSGGAGGAGGGSGLEGLFQQAAQMQQRVQDAQERAKARLVTGEAGGGLVRVTANGELSITKVEIDPQVTAGGGDVDMLQDLVVAATNDALRRARDLMKEEMGPLANMLEASGFGQMM